jgi:hypothetical protein
VDILSNKRRFVGCSIFVAFLFHAWFVLQAISAMPRRGLIDSDLDMAVFFPHAVLMSCLPPGNPFDDNVVSKWKVSVKFAEAFPASLVYGIMIALVFKILQSKAKRRAKA